MEKIKITIDNQEYDIITKMDEEDKKDEDLLDNDLDKTMNLEEILNNGNK